VQDGERDPDQALRRAQQHEPDDQWWRSAVIYQVYPRSFADSDGDGIGDLPGITSRLDHLVNLGVDAIWLSPFYQSPQKDGGYDVANYRDIDPLFGTLDDIDTLIATAHEKGLRVIIDLVPNHTSADHPWFQAALSAAPGSPERARYIFRDGHGKDGSRPPNNWKSIFGRRAWTRVTEADGSDGQWYLHLFDASQPDLDWTNPEVLDEFDDVLRFWLRRGVDGFRVDVAHGLVKEPGLPDSTAKKVKMGGSGHAKDTAEKVLDLDAPPTNYEPMFDQDGVHDIYRRWRRVLDEFDPPDASTTRALVAEAWVSPLSRLARYLRPDEMQQAFNFSFLATKWNAPAYRDVISESLATTALVDAPTTWVLSNHDVVRHPSRFGLKDPGSRPPGIYPHDEQPDEELGLRRGRAATLFMLALPGSAYLYQGEELGLPEHTTLPDEVRQAPEFFRTGGKEAGRDGCRVPLPWSAGQPAFGFSPTGKTWLPQPASWRNYAADVQTGVPGSTLELYRNALALRKQRNLGAGRLVWEPGFGSKVLAFRNVPDVDDDALGSTLVLANLGKKPVVLPTSADVLLASSELPGDGTLPPDTTAWLLTD